MSMFNYTIKYKPGKTNGNADNLSVYAVEEPRGSGKDDVVPIYHVSATPAPTTGIVELS